MSRHRLLTLVLLASFLALAAPARAEKVDVVVLRNGSRVICEVRSLAKSRLEVKTDDMGTLQIEWDKIASVTAPAFFEVEDMDGALHFGSLRPGASDDTVEVVADWGTDALPLWQVARIQLVKSGFWKRFKGSFDLGAGYTSATQLTQFTFDGSLRFIRPRFEASAEANAVLTHQPEVDDTQRSSALINYTRTLRSRHRAFAQASVERNRELGFNLRSSLVGGWGYMLVRDQHNELTGGVGVSINREQPVEGESTTNWEAAVGLDFANFAYDFPKTDIDLKVFGYLGLSQWGRFRLEASASLKRELFSDFYLGLKGYESYDSEPATVGAAQNDWGLTLTLGYSF